MAHDTVGEGEVGVLRHLSVLGAAIGGTGYQRHEGAVLLDDVGFNSTLGLGVVVAAGHGEVDGDVGVVDVGVAGHLVAVASLAACGTVDIAVVGAAVADAGVAADGDIGATGATAHGDLDRP